MADSYSGIKNDVSGAEITFEETMAVCVQTLAFFPLFMGWTEHTKSLYSTSKHTTQLTLQPHECLLRISHLKTQVGAMATARRKVHSWPEQRSVMPHLSPYQLALEMPRSSSWLEMGMQRRLSSNS